MTALDRIRERLAHFPTALVVEGSSSITVKAADQTGCDVSFLVRRNTFTVHFAGWHEDFVDEGEALACFAFGLSEKCRLIVSRRGGVDYRWRLEGVDSGRWVVDSETGLLFYPYFLPRSERTLQNRLISPGEEIPGSDADAEPE